MKCMISAMFRQPIFGGDVTVKGLCTKVYPVEAKGYFIVYLCIRVGMGQKEIK